MWAMPTADSIPADLEFEVGIVMNGAEEQTKTHMHFINEGRIDNNYGLNFNQAWIFGKDW